MWVEGGGYLAALFNRKEMDNMSERGEQIDETHTSTVKDILAYLLDLGKEVNHWMVICYRTAINYLYLYPFYMHDESVEVTDEVAVETIADKRY